MPTSARWLFPDEAEPFAILERARPWLEPHFVNERGHLLQSIHTYVVRTRDLLVVIDTGVGNDKDRSGGNLEGWHMRSGPFLEELRAAGADPEWVDVVVNTHMHGDHVGWNARLVDGRWVPTFPRARYLFVRPEWEHWQREAERTEAVRRLVDDSLQPVVDAGRAEVVPADLRISDELWLEPSHGHSPGHVNVRLSSRGVDAVFVGDALHSPIQCAVPDVRPTFDRPESATQARATRGAILEQCAGSGMLMLGAHFTPPAAGRVRREGEAFRFEAAL
ncbi:MAG: MBL fold metallo-hydrolase [Chloroflexi bacterium]|nr:MBL fold metallo-hydrolase [Chloroflexota bacterium]